MKKLNKPSLRVLEVREACEASIHGDLELKQRLNSVSSHLDHAEGDYENHGSAKTWFLIPEQADVGGLASKKDLAEAYERIRTRQSCRVLYDQIQQSAEFDDCPYCGEREVKTLDHYLAKSKYPGLSITPVNLVPSCYSCNNTKTDTAISDAEKQFLHPYYDDVENDQWLYAEVLETSPASFIFRATPPAAWDSTIKQRIEYHFDALELGKLYSKKSGRLLSGERKVLQKHLNETGYSDSVREYLQDRAESHYEDNKNDWKTAFYQACAACDWFCNGGFLKK